jgi:hypothetical protein
MAAALLSETASCAKYGHGLVGLNVGSKPRDLSILNRDVETIDRRLVRTNDAGILDDGVENLIHALS